MDSLQDPGSGARVFGPAKAVAWVTLTLMLLTAIYSVVMSIANWTDIGV